jgi:hypothetical protein
MTSLLRILLMDGFAFIVELLVHGVGAKGGLMGVLMCRVRVGIKGCVHKNCGKYLIFGCGCVQ